MIQYSLSCGHDFSLPLLSLFSPPSLSLSPLSLLSLSLLSLFSPSSLPLLSLFTLSQPPILRKKHQATSVLSQDTRGMCTQCKLAYCPINMLAISVHQGLGRENFRKTLKFTKKFFILRKFSTIRYITFSITHVMLNQSILGLVLGLGVRLICVILTPFPVHYQILSHSHQTSWLATVFLLLSHCADPLVVHHQLGGVGLPAPWLCHSHSGG